MLAQQHLFGWTSKQSELKDGCQGSRSTARWAATADQAHVHRFAYRCYNCGASSNLLAREAAVVDQVHERPPAHRRAAQAHRLAVLLLALRLARVVQCQLLPVSGGLGESRAGGFKRFRRSSGGVRLVCLSSPLCLARAVQGRFGGIWQNSAQLRAHLKPHSNPTAQPSPRPAQSGAA